MSCIHHWLINEKDYGTCRECGAERQFPNGEIIHQAAVVLGRLGGKKGGPARARKLTPEQRKEIARKAAQTRWGKEEDGILRAIKDLAIESVQEDKDNDDELWELLAKHMGSDGEKTITSLLPKVLGGETFTIEDIKEAVQETFIKELVIAMGWTEIKDGVYQMPKGI